MSQASKIEWTDRTWNPTRGCSIVSPGCHHCYAMTQAHRFSGPGGTYEGLTKLTKAGPQWTGKVVTVEDKLLEPLSWKTPARVFVDSMSDLFHEAVPDAFVDRVFAVMGARQVHTFQILTKRAARMRAYMSDPLRHETVIEAWSRTVPRFANRRTVGPWPLPNVWIGISAENQEQLEHRIGPLCQTPAAVRFLSCEPLLGPLDFAKVGGLGHLKAGIGTAVPGIDWVIVGGESGPGARPCALEWIERVVEQCRESRTPAFVKQLGAYVVSEGRTAPADTMSRPEHEYREFKAPNGEVWAWRAGLRDSKGGDPSEWPEDLRVRQFPEVRV